MQRTIIKSGRIRVGDHAVLPSSPAATGSRAAAPSSTGAPEPCGEPRVELLRVDGRVEAIELTCACGEVTVVRLEYESETPGAQPNATS